MTTAVKRLTDAWRLRRQARPWRAGSPPLLRYIVLTQRRPDSKYEPWAPWQTSVLDETVLSAAGENLHGIYLDVSVLTTSEQVELGILLNTRSKEQTADGTAREQELLVRCPRVGQVPGGYDLDFDDPADAARAAEMVKTEEARRGVVLRESWSGGESRGKRHLEWGHVDPHFNAMRACFGRALDVARAAGFTPQRNAGGVDKRFWNLPGDPDGERGMLDLSNLNRSATARGAMFRSVGGLHKDGKNRKALVPGSPPIGSPFTQLMLEEGLRFADSLHRPEFATGPGLATATFLRPANIPLGDQNLERTADVVSMWWKKGQGHPLRLAIAGTLLRTGLVTLAGAEQVLKATTGSGVDERGQPYDTTHDARATAIATARRLTNPHLRTAGANSLRGLVGSPKLFDLAWALAYELDDVSLEHVWDKITSSRNNELSDAKILELFQRMAAEAGAEALAISDEKQREALLERRVLIGMLRHRLMASRICRKRRNDARCTCCKGIRCKKHMECGDPSCNPCTKRHIRDVLECLQLPPRCMIVHRDGYTAKNVAEKAYRRLPRHGRKRPRALYSITPNGSWELTLLVDSKDMDACAAAATLEGATVLDDQTQQQVRNWVTRVLVLKHVTARQALETCDLAAAELLISTYRKHITSGHDRSVMWPTKAAIRELRKERAMKREKTPEELAEECACPEEVRKDHPPFHEIVNMDTGEVVVTDLERPPTLAQIAAHEGGERVKLHRRRRFGKRQRE